jgi:ethanolamine ammonia-lyase small subunit
MIDKQARQTINRLKALTPARIGVGRSGPRPLTEALLKFWADHADAKDAVKSKLSEQFIDSFCSQYEAIVVRSLAQNRDEFVLFPPRGKRLNTETVDMLKDTIASDRGVDVQIVVSDGLSAMAVEQNLPDIYPVLLDGFTSSGLSLAKPVIVQYGRVAVADQIGHIAGAKIAINLIGERPGLTCATGLSAYITYAPNPATTISSDRTVVSNIHAGGTPAVEAGAFIVKVVGRILQHKVSGVRLQALG